MNPLSASLDWYAAESEERHLQQVVVTVPAEPHLTPPVAQYAAGEPLFDAAVHAVTIAALPQVFEPGPYVMVRAADVINRLHGQPLMVALSFYRFISGAVFQILTLARLPETAHRPAGHFGAARAFYLGNYATRELIEQFVLREQLEACMIAPGEAGDGTIRHMLSADLPISCREVLQQYWDETRIYQEELLAPDESAALEVCHAVSAKPPGPLLPPRSAKPAAPERRAAALPPDHEEHKQQARAAIERHDFAAAVEHLTAVVEAKDDDAQSMVSLAVAHGQLGHFAEAEHYLSLACEIAPDMPQAHFNLGRLFQRRGMLEDAIRSYENAVRADRGYQRAKDALAALHAKLPSDLADAPADAPEPAEGGGHTADG